MIRKKECDTRSQWIKLLLSFLRQVDSWNLKPNRGHIWIIKKIIKTSNLIRDHIWIIIAL